MTLKLYIALLRLVRWLHHLDYRYLLPVIASAPLPLAYSLSACRGFFNKIFSRDWRSVALGTRHIHRQSTIAYGLLPTQPTSHDQSTWRRERFSTEAREEFEACLVIKNRVRELNCTFLPQSAQETCAVQERGLVLLTPHFDSFFLGSTFLARAGGPVNFMASAITHDPRVDPAVQKYFAIKYRSLELHLNGGKITNLEDGMRPFYRMLARKETLIVLGDSPPLQSESSDGDLVVNFLGANRRLAGGALRLAQSTDSNLGAYICQYKSPGNYVVELCPIGRARDPQTIQRIYDFFSGAILKNPGLWWGSDLLPNMPIQPYSSD